MLFVTAPFPYMTTVSDFLRSCSQDFLNPVPSVLKPCACSYSNFIVLTFLTVSAIGPSVVQRFAAFFLYGMEIDAPAAPKNFKHSISLTKAAIESHCTGL